MARILKWKVSAKPTGPYSSFHKWSWPTADYRTGQMAAQISCEQDYHYNKREHAPLFLWLADHSGDKWQWRKFKQPLENMEAVKDYAEQMLQKYPQFIPKS